MTTVPQYDTLNIEEELARLAKLRRDDEKTSIESQKLIQDIELTTLQIQDIKLATPRVFYLGAFTAAALIGATAVIAKVFFP